MRCGRRDTRRWRGRRLHRVDRRHRWRRSCDRRCGRLCVHGRCRCVHGRCRRMHCGRRRATDMGRRRRSGTCAIMHLVHLGARMRVGDRRTTGRAIAVRRGYAGEHMIARSRSPRYLCRPLCPSYPVGHQAARDCPERSPHRKSISHRLVAGCPPNVMALRCDGGNRRAGMRGNDFGPAQLARVPGRRDGRMAVIVVKRKRRIPLAAACMCCVCSAVAPT